MLPTHLQDFSLILNKMTTFLWLRYTQTIDIATSGYGKVIIAGNVFAFSGVAIWGLWKFASAGEAPMNPLQALRSASSKVGGEMVANSCCRWPCRHSNAILLHLQNLCQSRPAAASRPTSSPRSSTSSLAVIDQQTLHACRARCRLGVPCRPHF